MRSPRPAGRRPPPSRWPRTRRRRCTRGFDRHRRFRAAWRLARRPKRLAHRVAGEASAPYRARSRGSTSGCAPRRVAGRKHPLPAAAPCDCPDLQSHFEAKEEELWVLAKSKGYSTDILEMLPQYELIKALALLVLDEINALREVANLPPRTIEQLKAGLRNKMNGD